MYFTLTESTRWLISKGRLEQAKTDLQRRSTKTIPETLFEPAQVENKSLELLSIMDLFRPKQILFRSFNMFFQWFSVTMSYYGLLFSSTSLSGDPYLNLALVIFVELVNVTFYIKFMNLFGRKVVLISAQLVNGICCLIGGLLISYPHLATLQIILVMLGRMFAALGKAVETKYYSKFPKLTTK